MVWFGGAIGLIGMVLAVAGALAEPFVPAVGAPGGAVFNLGAGQLRAFAFYGGVALFAAGAVVAAIGRAIETMEAAAGRIEAALMRQQLRPGVAVDREPSASFSPPRR